MKTAIAFVCLVLCLYTAKVFSSSTYGSWGNMFDQKVDPYGQEVNNKLVKSVIDELNSKLPIDTK